MASKKQQRQEQSSGRIPLTTVMTKLSLFSTMCMLLILLPTQNAYSFRAVTETYDRFEALTLPSPAPIPVNITKVEAPPLTAEGIIIIDTTSGVTLYEKNPGLKLLPASTTKIMTALVVLEDYALEDVVTVKTVITEGQVMGLVKGETITVENLLYGILVHSANDAAYALAEHHMGGVPQFVARMNEKAQELHLTDTHFVNPIGFDDADHYTTPQDLARMTLFALHNPVFHKIVGVPQITVSDTSFLYFHPLKNINELLGKVPGVSGVKTGWTENAGQSLVSTVQRDGQRILIVVLRSTDRFQETEALLNWVFSNFQWKTFSMNQ